ncbi:VOC family protein [Bradyrhizobium elkanii]|uniref:VOC family protein n=1 Tax=Bradyrhizobium elkanii TaxID=29448 RepID=UPI001BA70A95|nr:VOC family protein [Bradyrhizobium elkanii]MBR1158091.1 VOC family protein [Bradyrhizobium elkanii]
MLDHIGFAVKDLPRAKAFYQATLAPLGIGVILEFTAEQTGKHAHVGFGKDGKPFFWIGTGQPLEGRFHVAFTVADRATVDAFHKAALAAGGADNGRPGIRAHYHPEYYGAFVTDPDGHNVEAVCHQPG